MRRNTSKRTSAAPLFTVALALGAGAYAPPAGADEPKEIEECQTITRPGSYALVRNLKADPGQSCLVIEADFVTIDLNGWRIEGDGGLESGIVGTGKVGITVRNGSITGFGFAGIHLEADGSIVEGVRAFGNINGILATLSSIVRGNTAVDNRCPEPPPFLPCGVGIIAGGVVTDNVARANNVGFSVLDGSKAADNTADNNIDLGIDTGVGVTLINNTVLDTDSGGGIDVGAGSTVVNNTAFDNVGFGIRVECPSNVIGNTASDSGPNIELVGAGCNDFQNVAPTP